MVKYATSVLCAILILGLAACKGSTNAGNDLLTTQNNTSMVYSKKYTNADFYKNGKFDEAAAFEAYKHMFDFYGVPFTPLMEAEM